MSVERVGGIVERTGADLTLLESKWRGSEESASSQYATFRKRYQKQYQ